MYHLRDLKVDGKVLLKWILNKHRVMWIETTQGRDSCPAFVNTVMHVQVPYVAVHLLTDRY
jgi:hypothetical protein